MPQVSDAVNIIQNTSCLGVGLLDFLLRIDTYSWTVSQDLREISGLNHSKTHYPLYRSTIKAVFMIHKLTHFPRTLNWEIDPKTVLLIRLILISWDEVQRQSFSFPVLRAVCYDSIIQFPSYVGGSKAFG